MLHPPFPDDQPSLAFGQLVSALEAAGEPTRLRILALLAEAELTVTELTSILSQSQPRVSRHLKLLVDAGLIDRHREGAWAFFRMGESEAARAIHQGVVALLDRADPAVSTDRRRLDAVRLERKNHAAAYFARHAADWGRIRALHIAEASVEAAVMAALGGERIESVLDLGTGTGRMIQLIGGSAARAVGLDVSPAMLSAARAHLDEAGLRHIQLRQGDAYAIPVDLQRFDLVILHQVLHYLDDPARAVAEAARAVRPGGRLLVVDFAPHEEESLRASHAHRRLGFSNSEITGFLDEAGLRLEHHHILPPSAGGKLAVSLWLARDPTREGDFPLEGSPLIAMTTRSA